MKTPSRRPCPAPDLPVVDRVHRLPDRITGTFVKRALTQAKLDDRIPDLTAEELYDMLAAKAIVVDTDRPRPKITRGG